LLVNDQANNIIREFSHNSKYIIIKHSYFIRQWPHVRLDHNSAKTAEK